MTSFRKLFVSFLAAVVLTGCGKDATVEKSEYDALLAERDSIAAAADREHASLTDLSGFLTQVAMCVDSISTQEGLLTVNRDPETGRKFSRREIITRINQFSDLIKRQRAQIAILTDSLGHTGAPANVAKLTEMIEYLNGQLEAKERQISQLRAEVASNRRSIESLNATVSDLNQTKAMLESENSTLDRTVAEQTNLMNEAYFLAAPKKELQEMGLLKGGFLKKSSFDASNVNLSKCKKIDQRTFTEVTLESKKPKLLTQAPAGSYTFEDDGDGRKRFIILDTTAFWSLSNVVIIQL